jgi:hypothetical protein
VKPRVRSCARQSVRRRDHCWDDVAPAELRAVPLVST